MIGELVRNNTASYRAEASSDPDWDRQELGLLNGMISHVVYENRVKVRQDSRAS